MMELGHTTCMLSVTGATIVSTLYVSIVTVVIVKRQLIFLVYILSKEIVDYSHLPCFLSQ